MYICDMIIDNSFCEFLLFNYWNLATLQGGTRAMGADTLGKKHDLKNIMFFSAFIPLVIAQILTMTSFSFAWTTWYASLDFVVIVLAYATMIFKILLVDKYKYRYTNVILVFILVLLFCHAAFIVEDWDFAILFALGFGSIGIELKKILKIYVIESLTIVLITTTLALVGVIPNLSITQYGRTRYAMGNFYCTDYAARMFFLMLTVLLIYHKTIKWFHLVIMLGISIAVFISTFAKLDFACMLLTLMIFAIHLIVSKHTKNRFSKVWNFVWPKIGILSVPVTAIGMLILTLMYSPDNSFSKLLDRILTNRLRLGHNGFSEFGVRLLGQPVNYHGGYDSADVYNFVDCSYLHILFREGLIAVLAVIIMYVLIGKKHQNQIVVMYIVSMIALNCMIAHHMIEIDNNPLGLLLFANCGTLFSDRESGLERKEGVSDENKQ